MAPLRQLCGIGVLVCAVSLAGCMSIESPGVSAEVSAVPSAAVACEPIALQTPTGERLDLTGTWRGGIGIHYVRQEGTCVWWVAMSDNPGEPDGASTLIMFRGEISPDFTITGEWMSVYRSAFITDRRIGTVSFNVSFASSDGAETITLESTEPEIEQGGSGPYQGRRTLTYEGPLPGG